MKYKVGDKVMVAAQFDGLELIGVVKTIHPEDGYYYVNITKTLNDLNDLWKPGDNIAVRDKDLCRCITLSKGADKTFGKILDEI